MSTANRHHRTQSRRRSLTSRVLPLGVAGTLALVALPGVAQGASRNVAVAQGQHPSSNSPRAKSSICSKVSAASVSSIVGWKVPAPTSDTFTIKPTKANYEISGTNTICTYGPETSMAAIVKAVSLSYEVISKPLTTAEMQQSIAKATKGAKFKFSAYSGQGVTGFYFSLTEAGITGQGITGIANGTHYYGASVETSKVSKSALGALAKLASNL